MCACVCVDTQHSFFYPQLWLVRIINVSRFQRSKHVFLPWELFCHHNKTGHMNIHVCFHPCHKNLPKVVSTEFKVKMVHYRMSCKKQKKNKEKNVNMCARFFSLNHVSGQFCWFKESIFNSSHFRGTTAVERRINRSWILIVGHGGLNETFQFSCRIMSMTYK